jgi:carbonic anhydrase/acetyltransferase-like protein (isoleucine patch superfamily)
MFLVIGKTCLSGVGKNFQGRSHKPPLPLTPFPKSQTPHSLSFVNTQRCLKIVVGMSFLSAVGVGLRSWGKSINSIGVAMQGNASYVEKCKSSTRSIFTFKKNITTHHLFFIYLEKTPPCLFSFPFLFVASFSPLHTTVVPSARIVAHGGKLPTVAPSAFVAPSASIVGQVNISEGAGIWYNAVVRGDQAKVSIGTNSTVQERVVINATTPTSIGNNVVVGVGAQLSGCTLGNHTLVGVGASVQEGAVVESGAVVAAGSVVGKGLTIPAGQLWSGNPVAYLRDLTSAESLALANSGKWWLWCGWWWCGGVVVWCGSGVVVVWCGAVAWWCRYRSLFFVWFVLLMVLLFVPCLCKACFN